MLEEGKLNMRRGCSSARLGSDSIAVDSKYSPKLNIEYRVLKMEDPQKHIGSNSKNGRSLDDLGVPHGLGKAVLRQPRAQ